MQEKIQADYIDLFNASLNNTLFSQTLFYECLHNAINTAEKHNVKVNWNNNEFVNVFSQICYKVLYNIRENPALLEKINLDSIRNLPFMTSFELYPQASAEERKNIEIRRKQVISEKFSDRIVCDICKQKKVIYDQVQTRGGDEAPSIRYTCRNCNNSWITR